MSEEYPSGIKITSEVTSDVPLPQQPLELPLDTMKVGDSFTVEVQEERHRQLVAQRVSRYKKRNPPKEFSMRKESENTYRIFRFEDRKPDEIHE